MTTGRDTPDDRVRAVVRVLMAANGMRPADLAAQLGMTKNQVWDRMRGDRAWTVSEVAGMAEVFGADVAVFFAGPEAILGSTRPGGRHDARREPPAPQSSAEGTTRDGNGPRHPRLKAA
jgi:hypothetical protein